jgi:hypothetical protein
MQQDFDLRPFNLTVELRRASCDLMPTVRIVGHHGDAPGGNLSEKLASKRQHHFAQQRRNQNDA